jgi:hypothetical protein
MLKNGRQIFGRKNEQVFKKSLLYFLRVKALQRSLKTTEGAKMPLFSLLVSLRHKPALVECPFGRKEFIFFPINQTPGVAVE